MKFGAQLELYAVPEWQEQYIRYNALKRFISRKLAEQSKPSVVSQLASFSRRGSFVRNGGPSPLFPLLAPAASSDISSRAPSAGQFKFCCLSE